MSKSKKLTKEVERKLVNALSAGNYIETSCLHAGISVSSYYKWKKAGEDGDPDYEKFANAVNTALAAAEMGTLDIVRQVAVEESDAKAAQWLLSHRFGSRWGDTKRVVVEAEKMLDKVMTHLESSLPEDIFVIVVNAIAEMDEFSGDDEL